MNQPISDDLRKILELWWEDAHSEIPSRSVQQNGLCHFIHRSWPTTEAEEEFNKLRLNYLKGRDPQEYIYPYPFGETNYYRRYHSMTQHKDPERLAFVANLLNIPFNP